MVTFVTPWGSTVPLTTNTAPQMGLVNRYNVSGGAFSVTLPALSALNVGARTIIEKDRLDGSGNLVTVNRAGADTFDDGTTSFTVASAGQQETVQVVSIGGIKYWKRFSGGGSAGGGVTLNGVETLTNKTLTAPLLSTIELGHASDTTLSRSAAGVLAVEGVVIPSVSSTDTLVNKTLTTPKIASGGYIADPNGNEQVVFNSVPSAVNGISVTNSATLNPPTMAAFGTDSNIDLWINGQGSGRVYVSGYLSANTSEAQTFSNKRILPRPNGTTSSATPAINTDLTDIYTITALTVNITSMTSGLTGTPTDGQLLWIGITGTAARTITWGSKFVSSTVTLPTTTVSTNRIDVGLVYDLSNAVWRCVAVA